MSDMGMVEGKIAVKAVLDSKYRKVNKVILDKDKHNSDVAFIVQQARKKNIPIKLYDSTSIDILASGKTHGGILADVTDRKTQTITACLKNEKPFVALLEGIEDSYNLGYIFRTLYAFGCDAVIMKEHYVDYDDGNLLKSSAGASELLPIIYSDDLGSCLTILRNKSIKVISMYRGNNATSLYDTDLHSKGIVVAIGGPLRGLSNDVLNNTDEYVYIPYANDFRNALNAASATSVVASEVFRQRSGGK
jgi:23S rRNA (guanosine2251-2'-O)-methyltransferase